MGNLKQQHTEELIRTEAQIYRHDLRRRELLAIIATLEAVEKQQAAADKPPEEVSA